MAKTDPVILLIEDDPMISTMYKTKFSLEKFHLETAADGEAGLEKVRALHPAIVLLDIILPKLDGFAVLKAIKEDAATKDTKVVLLSNLGQDDDVSKGKKLGADDYFIKSNHTPAEIVEKVKSLLQ